jgi:hypothetical protein
MIIAKFTGPETHMRIADDLQSCTVLPEPPSDPNPSRGVGDFFFGNCVFIYTAQSRLWLVVNGTEVDTLDPSFAVQYKHLDGGRSLFSAMDSKHKAEIVYPSWWVDKAGASAGLGSNDDDDMDVCAYLHFMLSSPSRAEHLRAKFERGASPRFDKGTEGIN